MSRTPYVVVPLLVALALTGATGAQMLFADPDPADASEVVACWDGASAESFADCSRPRGEAGLAWVFPSLDTAKCSDVRSEDRRRGPLKLTCVETVGSVPVTVRYGAVGAVKGGLSYYEERYAAGNRTEARAPDGSVNRYVWRLREPTGDGVWLLSSMYRQHPFFVTVEAPTRAARDRAFKRLVEMRDPDEVRGVGGG